MGKRRKEGRGALGVAKAATSHQDIRGRGSLSHLGQTLHPHWPAGPPLENPWSIHQSLERVLTLHGQEEGFPQSLCFKPAPVRPMRVNQNTSGPGETLALSLHPGLSPSLPHSFQLFNFPSPWQHLKAGRLKYKSPPNHYEQDLSALFRAVGPE